MIYDVVTFNGEYELFELRYNILKDYVDQFVVIEFDKTFSGIKKENFFNNKYDKTIYWLNTENLYLKYAELAESSPNTVGAKHWKTEFMQKESVKDRLKEHTKTLPNGIQDDDIVFIGDVDEIVEPLFYVSPPAKLTKFKLRVYTYWLNNRSTEVFWGPICAKYADIKNECLNHLRNNHEQKNTINECGWHFTSLKDGLKQKLEDSYTAETYATDAVMGSLEDNINNNRDFLGRGFTYTVDESEWPEYLKKNKERYLHLCK